MLCRVLPWIAIVAALATPAAAQTPTVTVTPTIAAPGALVVTTISGPPGAWFVLLGSTTGAGYRFADLDLHVGADAVVVETGLLNEFGRAVVTRPAPFIGTVIDRYVRPGVDVLVADLSALRCVQRCDSPKRRRDRRRGGRTGPAGAGGAQGRSGAARRGRISWPDGSGWRGRSGWAKRPAGSARDSWTSWTSWNSWHRGPGGSRRSRRTARLRRSAWSSRGAR